MIKITKKIEDLRAEIDSIDKEIIQLIINRMNVVKEVGEVKKNTKGRVYVPERENEIFFKLSEKNQVSPQEVKNIYTEIISFCRKFENILDIGITEEKNSLLALKNILGTYTNPIFCNSTEELKDFNYIILPFSKNLLNLVENYSYKIINFSEINKEKFFLISKEENTLTMKNFYSYYISSEPIEIFSVENIKIDEKKYFIISENKIISNENIKFIGSSPKI